MLLNAPKDHIRTIGVNSSESGKLEICVWAPFAKKIEIEISKPINKKFSLEKQDFGYWTLSTNEIKVGFQYLFIIDGNKKRPDPASLSQPEGVHGISEVVDLSKFRWTDQNWQNIPLSKYIIYELHTGTFSDFGTFNEIISKIEYLKELGINAVEIMPVSQFPGNRNWGYDGVFPFAVQNSYGGAIEFQKLVNECHRNGLAVILDVVYNHLGPEGNYLSDFGPYFTDKYKTPWGKSINYDDSWSEEVRQFFIENALMWFRDFHVDALRLDAVHTIQDSSSKHFLRELKERTNQLSEFTGKSYYLIAESNLNDTKFINSFDKSGHGLDAQWSDDFHHAIHAFVTKENKGYYSDFGQIEQIAKSYNSAFVYDGIYSQFRKKKIGTKLTDQDGSRFVVFSQNHDQIGNRMLGNRMSTLVNFEMLKLFAAAVFISPYIPMIFMGEEFGETNPFLYFVDHSDENLIKAVREGRKREFKDFLNLGEMPDPQDDKTFLKSKLNWNFRSNKSSNTLFQFYQKLIDLRKNESVFNFTGRKNTKAESKNDNKIVVVERWNDDSKIICLMNFDAQKHEYQFKNKENWELILDSSDNIWYGLGTNCPNRISRNENFLLNAESIVIYKGLSL